MKKGRRELFRETLAWARIDFDFNTNEALIEELQTDWIRIARRLLKQMEYAGTRFYAYGTNTSKVDLKTYLESVLVNYGKLKDARFYCQ